MADSSNPRIQLPIIKVFTAKNIYFYFYIAFSRREGKDSNGDKIDFSKLYSLTTIKIHQDWENQLYNNLAAKVVVIFGQATQRAWSATCKGRYERLDLWGNIPVSLQVLYWDKSHSVIERLIIFTHHPKCLYRNWTVEAGALVDAQLNTAAALARAHVEKPNYFESRAEYYTYNNSKKQPKGLV